MSCHKKCNSFLSFVEMTPARDPKQCFFAISEEASGRKHQPTNIFTNPTVQLFKSQQISTKLRYIDIRAIQGRAYFIRVCKAMEQINMYFTWVCKAMKQKNMHFTLVCKAMKPNTFWPWLQKSTK